MFNRNKYEVRVPLDPAKSDEPRQWPYGWSDCPTCDNGRRIEDDVCMTCAAEGKTFDWTFGRRDLTEDEERGIRKPGSRTVAVSAGDTVTFACNYEVRERYETAKYRCPFKMVFKVKQPGFVDLNDLPEAMYRHIGREKHFDIQGRN
jgi:DNA-directed RNA polymerase subunit RPC12/RpoP